MSIARKQSLFHELINPYIKILTHRVMNRLHFQGMLSHLGYCDLEQNCDTFLFEKEVPKSVMSIFHSFLSFTALAVHHIAI